jgi:hypothetical protein
MDGVHRDVIEIDADQIEAVERSFLRTPVELSAPVRH